MPSTTWSSPSTSTRPTTVVKRALEKPKAPRAARRRQPGRRPSRRRSIGTSPAMQDLFKSIALVAPTDVPVLITGESGTGKELVARAIHRHSGRRDGPVPARLPRRPQPEPRRARALRPPPRLVHRGRPGPQGPPRAGRTAGPSSSTRSATSRSNLQVKLLRAIEHREVDAGRRRTAAADRHPGHRRDQPAARRADGDRPVPRGPVLPPERLPDPHPAAPRPHATTSRPWPSTSCGSPGRRTSPTPTSPRGGPRRTPLRPWTGNVRELRNAIEHAAIVARGQPIRPEHLPPVWLPPTPTPASATDTLRQHLATWAHAETQRPDEINLYEHFLELTEPPLLRAVLHHHQNNRANAAQTLGIHRATLRQKLRKYGIEDVHYALRAMDRCRRGGGLAILPKECGGNPSRSCWLRWFASEGRSKDPAPSSSLIGLTSTFTCPLTRDEPLRRPAW